MYSPFKFHNLLNIINPFMMSYFSKCFLFTDPEVVHGHSQSIQYFRINCFILQIYQVHLFSDLQQKPQNSDCANQYVADNRINLSLLYNTCRLSTRSLIHYLNNCSHNGVLGYIQNFYIHVHVPFGRISSGIPKNKKKRV